MRAILVVVFSLFTSAGLAQPHLSKAAYKRIFSDAITASLQSKEGNNLCLPQMYWGTTPGAETITINQNMLNTLQGPGSLAAQMKALEEAGLVTGTASERMVNGKTESVRIFTRTELGSRYYSEGHFCYGRAELDKIIKWKGPATFDEYRIAMVYFTIKAVNVADWAKLPAVLAAFPVAKASLQDNPPKVRTVFVDLSSEGWEVNEFSRYLQ